jgi:predicted RNase H-like nuclease (RuvC/YqgF family)
MNFQESSFNNRIIFATLVAVIIGILIAFYYSYAQSRQQIRYLEQERSLLIKDLSLIRSEVDRLLAFSEVKEIELQESENRVEQLLDSVGRLNFNISKIEQYRREMKTLEARYTNIKNKQEQLQSNNTELAEKYEETREMLEDLKGRTNSLAETETLLREKNQELSQELKRKSYLSLADPLGNGFKLKRERPVKTNKAESIVKLRGCVTVKGNPNTNKEEKVIYLQFLAPDMAIIENNASLVTVNGNVYSKKVELVFTGEEMSVCDFITVPEGSLDEGIYTLNVFEDEKLLSTSEFRLK